MTLLIVGWATAQDVLNFWIAQLFPKLFWEQALEFPSNMFQIHWSYSVAKVGLITIILTIANLNNFGVDQVPYLRNKQTNIGSTTIAYNRANSVDPGVAGFDGSSNSKLLKSLATGQSPSLVSRRSVGIGSTLTVLWNSRRQVGANRRVAQRSVVNQSSLSATVKSIHQQGGQIISITTNG